MDKNAVFSIFGKVKGARLINWLSNCCDSFCDSVRTCLGINPDGDPDLFLNIQGNFVPVPTPPPFTFPYKHYVAFMTFSTGGVNPTVTVIYNDIDPGLVITRVAPGIYMAHSPLGAFTAGKTWTSPSKQATCIGVLTNLNTLSINNSHSATDIGITTSDANCSASDVNFFDSSIEIRVYN